MRLTMRSRVVFPEPLVPTSTVHVCEGMVQEKASTAGVAPP